MRTALREVQSLSKNSIVNEFIKQKASEDKIDPLSIVTCHPSETTVLLSMSQESAEYHKLCGKCLRGAFLRRQNFPVTNPIDIISKRRMAIGIALEKLEQEYIRRAGFAKATNKKFIMYLRGRGIMVSGEIDLILKGDGLENITGTLDGPNLSELNFPAAILEIKTFYGYNARKEIFGNKSIEPSPKSEHVLQTALYLEAANCDASDIVWLKETYDSEGNFVEYTVDDDIDFKTNIGVIYYVDRGTCDSMEHIIELDKYHRIKVNGNDQTAIGISFENVYGNFEILADAVRNNVVPERTSRYQYPEQQVNYMSEHGMIAKTRMENHRKGQGAIGDWQCLYCDWKRACLGSTPWEADTIPSIDLIQEAIEIIQRRDKGE